MKEPGPVGLYNRIVHGIDTPVPPGVAELGNIGRALEWGVAHVAITQLGRDCTKLRKPPTRLRPGGRQWSRYSLDPILEDSAGPLILEVKVRAPHRLRAEGWGEPGTDQVPIAIYTQVQAQLDAIAADREFWTGTRIPEADGVAVCVLWGVERVDVYWVPRVEADGASVRAAAEQYWADHIVPRYPPLLDATSGSACYIAEHYRPSRSTRAATPTEASALDDYLDAEYEWRSAGERRETLRHQIAEIVGESGEALRSDGALATLATTRGRVDEQAVVRELAERLGMSASDLAALRERHRSKPSTYLRVYKR
jgi:hypothetical protein